MNRIVEEQGYWGGQFEMPDGIVEATICHKSGQLPDAMICSFDPTGKGMYTEYFEEGTVPTDYCDVHVSAYVCSETGLLASAYCPGYYQICIKRPDDIKGGPAKGITADSLYAYPGAYCMIHTAANQGGTAPATDTGGTDMYNTGGDDYNMYDYGNMDQNVYDMNTYNTYDIYTDTWY